MYVDEQERHLEQRREAPCQRRPAASLRADERHGCRVTVAVAQRPGQDEQVRQSLLRQHELIPVQRVGYLDRLGEPSLKVVLPGEE